MAKDLMIYFDEYCKWLLTNKNIYKYQYDILISKSWLMTSRQTGRSSYRIQILKNYINWVLEIKLKTEE